MNLRQDLIDYVWLLDKFERKFGKRKQNAEAKTFKSKIESFEEALGARQKI